MMDPFDSDRGDELARVVRELAAERSRSEELSAALAQARLQVASLEQRLRQASDDEGSEAGLRVAFAEQTEIAERYRAEATDLRSMFDAMQHRIDVLQQRAGDANGESALREQLAEIEAQRAALAEELERERRLHATAGADPRTLNGGNAARMQALQVSFDAAVAKHAEDVRELREEVELYRALARDRETELSRVNEECSILRQSMESAIVELDGVRAGHSDLSEQLRRFGDGRFEGGGLESGRMRLDTESASDGSARNVFERAELDDIDDWSARRRLLVVNVDGNALTRGGIEEAVADTPGALYCGDPAAEPPADVEVCLAVNLVSDEFDLGWLSDTMRWGLDAPEALAYCGREGQGVFFRKVMFFPPPCDFDDCAARLLAVSETLQRVLVVGEDVDFMSGLRESLGRVRISTAIAFDGSQTVDLIPMVKPQMVLVDLNLPNGEGLRIAATVASNPDLGHVALGMFWSQAIDPVSFRQQALHAMDDLRIDRGTFARSVRESLDTTMQGMLRSPLPDRALVGFGLSNQTRS